MKKVAVFVLIAALSSGVYGSLEDILAPLPPVMSEARTVARVSGDRVEARRSPSIEKTAYQRDSSLSSRSSLAGFSEAEPLEIFEAIADREEAAVGVDSYAFPIMKEDLLRAIEEEVGSRLRPAGRLALAPMRPLPDLSKHSQPFHIRLGTLPGRLSRNTLYLNVQVENDEGVLGRYDIPFRPYVYNDVWYPKRNLRRGDLATTSELEMREVDMLVETEAVIADAETLLRHEYSRDVRPGKPLTWNDIEERSLVRKGQVVEVIAYQGMIAISMRAKAQQDGVRGDVVFLRNLESNKDFAGEVVGDGRVQVSF